MKKQTKKSRLRISRRDLFIILLILVTLGTTSLTVIKDNSYNIARDQANITGIRGLILLSIRGVKKDAPVDPRTGDVYFPGSRLYLPDPSSALMLTYLQDSGNIADSQSELSVSTYPVFGTTGLYEADNSRQLFAAVPKLQACSRGIKLVYQKFPLGDNQNVLMHTVTLNNGKILYIYVERACPELNPTADLFTNIRSY